MDHSDVIHFVNTVLYDSKGSIKRYSSKLYKENSAYIDYINLYTDFLEPSASLAQRVWHILNSNKSSVKCNRDGCGLFSKWNKQKSAYSAYCCATCAHQCSKRKEKAHLTNLEKFGNHPMRVDSVVSKLKATLTNRYGVDSFSKTNTFKQKVKNTSLEKYGVENPMQCNLVKEKYKLTNLAKFGVEYPIQNTDILHKRQTTFIEKYGVVSPTLVPEIRKKQQDTLFEHYGVENRQHLLLTPNQTDLLNNKDYLCELLKTHSATSIAELIDVDTTTVINYLHRHGIHDQLTSFSRSRFEDMVCRFLDSNNIPYETNTRNIIKPKELDIFLPDYRIGIEINGVYWHSDLRVDRNPSYHYDKWTACKQQGISLYTFFDDDLTDERKWKIIQSKIMYAVKKGVYNRIGARQCTISSVDVGAEREFLDKNHIQGFLNNRDKSYGAYYNNQLVGIFSVKARNNYLEIVRYSTDITTVIPGLFSKFLSYMIGDMKYTGTIVSFSDNCHSTGALYKSAGFTQSAVLGPGYSYTLAGAPRENRQRYMKSKIKKKFNIDVDNSTEKEIMKSLGYGRVYDCGKIKWLKVIE